MKLTLGQNLSDSIRLFTMPEGSSFVRTVIFLAMSCVATAGRAVAQPVVSMPDEPPATPILVWGHERLAWDQYAPTARLLGQYVFTALIDDRFHEPLDNVVCATTPSENGYECSSRLPRMAPGTHSIQLSARVTSEEFSGPWSAPIRVTLQARTSTGAPNAARGFVSGGSAQVVLPETSNAVDLTSLPDGRVLIAHRDGRIVAATDGGSSTAVDLGELLAAEAPVNLLALAVDPEFESTRYVFVAYATADGLTVARLREVNGTLGDHAVLRTGLVRSMAEPAAAIAVGDDRKLYVATGGNDDDRWRDPYAARVLRLNLDGSTPQDSATAPIAASGMQRPAGLGWSADGLMWLVGVPRDSAIEAWSIPTAAPFTDRQAAYSIPTPLPQDGRVVAVARRGEIVVLADDRRSLLWLSPLTGDPGRSKWLVRGELGVIQAVGHGLQGALLVLSDLGLFVLSPP